MRFRPVFMLTLLCLSFFLVSLATANSARAEATWTWEHPLPAGDAVNDVCSPAPGIAFAVGPFGKILRRTAGGWEKLDSPVTEDLNAVWAWSATDMVAVGDNGTILLYNGTTFTQLDASIPVDVTGVWGTSNKKFWILAGYVIFYYNGVSWTWAYVDPNSIVTFNDIHGTSATDIYAVGDWGAFVHYDGTTWGDTTPAHPWASPYAMNSVWSMDTGETFVVGVNGYTYRYDPSGPSWTSLTGAIPSYQHLTSVWGSSPTNVYTGDGFLYHYDGAAWSAVATAQGTVTDVTGIGGSSASEVFITTKTGDLFNYNGAVPTNELENALWGFNALWCPPGGQPLGCGHSKNDADYNGALFVRGDSGWAMTPVIEGGITDMDFLGVWGRSASDAYAVGYKEDSSNKWAAAAHYNGASWSTLDPNLLDTELGAVWCATGTNVFAVGDNLDGGVIYEYTGSAWNNVTPTTGLPPFRCVWGSGPSDIWAGGVGGSLYHYGGSAWEAVTDSGASDNILNIWGTSASNVYLVAGNYVYHFDGSTWTTAYSSSIALQGLHGFSANDIWCSANDNTLVHYDGSTWAAVDEHFASFSDPFGMCGASNKFWFLDGEGGVLRRDAPGSANLVPARFLLLNN